MKRKFLSIISFVLALTMILPMSIFVSADLPEGAAIEANPSTIYTGGETTKTTLRIVGVTPTKTNWSTLDTDIVSVDSATGEVTAKSKGTAKITANFRYTVGEGADAQEVDGSLSTTITVEEYKIVDARIGSETVLNYVDGQSIPKSDIEVEVKYNDSENWITTEDFDYTPKTASKDNSKITVTVTGYSTKKPQYDINVAEYNPADYVKAFEISYPTPATEFYAGDKLKTSDVEVKITDINGNITYAKLSDNANLKASGITFTNGEYTFPSAAVTTKPTLTVEYTGTGKTDSVTLNVKEKQSTGTELTFTLRVSNPPTKKEYTVGDTFDRTGMTITVKDNNGKTYSGSECDVTYTDYVFKDSDAGKTSITLNAGVNLKSKPGITYNTTITVSGLTIKAASTKLDIYKISSFTLDRSKYPVGYTISMDDVETITYYATSSSSSKKNLSGLDLAKHADEFTIEVLDSYGDEKSRRSTKIEENDVFEEKDSKGNKVECVYIRLTADNATATNKTYRYCTMTVAVGESGVYYYMDDEYELVKIYESIDDALKYAQEQDDDVEDDFDLDDVTSRHHVLLKLGENQRTSSTKKIELNHNVVIDLNGHDLTFYEDRLGYDDKDCTLTITNTSSTAAKITYSNVGITLTLSKGDELEFEYGEEIPGVYTVTVITGANGTVTATPKITNKDEIKVGHGSDIKFTITPKTDYELDTIKVDTKAVTDKDYTTSSTGVVTYTLKAVSKSCKVDITFKKKDTTKTWKNPFTDVSASDPYYSAVKFVYENELFNGTSTTKFSPDTTMTRAMFVTVLGRLSGADVSRFKTSSYSDVPINSTTSWYAPYVEWATQMGLVEGYGDGTFGPNNKITRQQMYVLMYRYTTFVENKKISLTSVPINASDAADVADWAYDAVRYASQNNFLVKIGTSSRIDPKGEAKRSELAQLLEKYCVTVLNWENK